MVADNWKQIDSNVKILVDVEQYNVKTENRRADSLCSARQLCLLELVLYI